MTHNEKQKLQRYSKICVPCAKELGGKAVKEELWFSHLKCEVCNKETDCIPAKDYGLGGSDNDK